ncbi:MAG: hypothetical protein JXQ99_13905 [Hyphomicrobiaceae bacterium]
MRRILVAMVTCFLAVGSAQAFEKTSPGAGQGKTGKALELSPGKPLGSGSGGAEVRIPGLGTLGVLPKLDFGLELLYGDGQAQAVTPQEDEPDTDGLRIRGTLKHRF